MPRPRLKLHHLANLQDARYGAALGVDYLSFSLERGSLLNLNPALVREIAPWLSGPAPVLSFGGDVGHAVEQAELIHEVNGLAEYDALLPLAASIAPGVPYALRLSQPSELQLAQVDILLGRLLGAQYLDVAVPFAVLPQLRALLPPDTALLLAADDLTEAQVEEALPLVDGFSFGRKLRDDFSQLDYDAFERLLDCLPSE